MPRVGGALSARSRQYHGTPVSMSNAAKEGILVRRRVLLGNPGAELRVRYCEHHWADEQADLLSELAVPELAADLLSTVDSVGDAEAKTLGEIYAEATAVAVTARRDRLAELRSRHATLTVRRSEAVEERDRIAAEHDDVAGKSTEGSPQPASSLGLPDLQGRR